MLDIDKLRIVYNFYLQEQKELNKFVMHCRFGKKFL